MSKTNRATFFCFFSWVAYVARKEDQTNTTYLTKCRTEEMWSGTFWRSGCPILNAKMCFRPYRGIAFLPPKFGYCATGIGCERKSFRFRKNPLYSVIPLRNNPQSKEHPIWVSAELIYKSCFFKASASEQLGVSSFNSDCLSKSPYSSVTKGRFSTDSYFSESGCLISPTVDNITCPVYLLFPKSNQYFGLSR